MELFRKRPLFAVPGESELELLDKIMHTCGTPTPATWPQFAMLSKDAKWARHDGQLDKVMNHAGVPLSCQRLVRQLLSMNPATRPTAAVALKSPFFSEAGDMDTLLQRCVRACVRACVCGCVFMCACVHECLCVYLCMLGVISYRGLSHCAVSKVLVPSRIAGSRTTTGDVSNAC